LISGPIVRQLNIACEGQLISKGSNPSIGRAVGLIVRNIGGGQSGENYMDTFGYPLAFAISPTPHAVPNESLTSKHPFVRLDLSMANFRPDL